MKGRAELMFVALSGLVVVGAIIAGIRAIGSPSDNRVRQFDARRVADLQDIQRAIDLRWSTSQTLPASLDDVRAQADPPPGDRDPVNGRSYEYRTVGNGRYELCAEFSESSTLPDVRPQRGFWSHPAGRHCFVLEPRDLTP